MELQKSDTSSLAESSSGDSDVINHNSKNVSAKPKQPFLCFGLMCCILSGLFFSVNALMVKMVKSIGPIQMLGARCWVQFVILLPFVMYNWKIRGVDFIGPTKSFKLLLLRSLTGSSAAMIFYQSIARLPLGDAVTLMFSSIVFVHIFSFFFLHERPTVLDIFFSVVILVGVVFIAKPPFIFDSATVYDTARLYGTLFGVLAASLAALTFVIVRKLGIATHCSLNVLYYSFVGSLTSLIFTPTIEGFKLPCSSEVGYILAAGFSGCAGQLFMALGLQYERAGTFSMLKSLQIVLSFIFQITILHNIPSTLSLAGACLIFSSIFGIAIRKIYNECFKDSENCFEKNKK